MDETTTTIEQAEATYDARVDEWLAACERDAARGGDGYASNNMDAMLAARDALALSSQSLGLRMATAVETLAAMRRGADERRAWQWMVAR